MADIREDEMIPVNSVDYVRGLKGKNSVLIAPANLPHPNTGGEYVEGELSNGKWYRIAIGNLGNRPSTGVFNIGNMYNNAGSKAILIYAFAEGYSGGSTLTKIASSPNSPIGKARVLYSSSNSYLEVYSNLFGINLFFISASSLIGFRLQVPKEVTEAIPEGYSVKEVSF